MLIIALNYIENTGENFGPLFAKTFNDFMVVTVQTNQELSECRFNFFSPSSVVVEESEIARYLDVGIHVLALRGPEARMQKSLRYMFFSKEENEKFLVEGENCAVDFPWAIQIAVCASCGLDFSPETRAIISEADVFIHYVSTDSNDESYAAKIKSINPYIDYFMQKSDDCMSVHLQKYFTGIFSDYLTNRERIKEMLAVNHPDKQITCAQAYKLAGKLGVSVPLVGNICDEFDYRITRCRLGCF